MVWWDVGNVFLSSSSSSAFSDPTFLTSQSTLPPISLPPNLRIFQQKCLEEKKMCVCALEGRKLFDNQVYLSAKVAASSSNGLYGNRKLIS